jgi:hypothetical protein
MVDTSGKGVDKKKDATVIVKPETNDLTVFAHRVLQVVVYPSR